MILCRLYSEWTFNMKYLVAFIVFTSAVLYTGCTTANNICVRRPNEDFGMLKGGGNDAKQELRNASTGTR